MEKILDLAPYAQYLLNYEDLSPILSDDDERKLVDFTKALHTLSHNAISKRYPHWDAADAAHDVYVNPDATDFREKAVIPDTRAIADTVVTYLMAALTGRNPMFQLEGLNRTSRKPALLLERVLHQNMRRTAGEAKIAQFLLDTVRYGFAPTKITWLPDANQNYITNANPRHTFPDPRVTWGDWANSEFQIFSDTITVNSLIAAKAYPRVKTLLQQEKLTQTTRASAWPGHSTHKDQGRGLSIDANNQNQDSFFRIGDAKWRDECWVRLTGYQIGIPSIETIYLTWTIVDEKHVINFQLSPHGKQIPSVLGGLYLDAHKTFSQSLYDLLLPLHDIATWLLRSRVDNVQAALTNLIFADPTMVSIPDLIDRNPWGVVRTLPGTKPGEGIHIAQIPDVTRGHWSDIAALSEMKQRLSAASDAQQGMPTPDVRSATEIQRLTQLGSQRLGVLSRILSATSVRPMVHMMVQNIQDALTLSGSLKTDGKNLPSQLMADAKDGYIDYGVSDLQGTIDYLVIDGTLPLEPTRNAQTWLTMLQVLQSSGMILEFRADQIVEEAILAMGISDLDRFRIGKDQQQNLSPAQQLAIMEKMRGMSQQPGQPGQQPGNQVMPNEAVQREVEKGNLIPMSQRH